MSLERRQRTLVVGMLQLRKVVIGVAGHVGASPRTISRLRLVGCSRFNGPLRQYFSLYRAVSQREGEREEKG